MAIDVELFSDDQVTLSTTNVERIVPGSDVDIVWVSADGDVLLIFDDSVDDGDATPANRGLFLPTGVIWPVKTKNLDPRAAEVSVVAVSGTPLLTASGDTR